MMNSNSVNPPGIFEERKQERDIAKLGKQTSVINMVLKSG
jgi:hypothetical protein